MNLVDSEYVCIHCPDNMQSVQASTAITDCKCNPGYTGPDGVACTPCPVNTYKAVLGDFPCTYCNASNVGCPTPAFKATAAEKEALVNCHAAAVSAPGSTPGMPGKVIHPIFGEIQMNNTFGTNCSYAAPSLEVCTNFSGLSRHPESTFSQFNCTYGPVNSEMVTIGSFNNRKVNMQYCIFLGQPPDQSCKAFGNVSLQRWPVTTSCVPCFALSGSPQCCFLEHLVRPCSPAYPGGSPGHCVEVGAEIPKDPALVQLCSTT
mmetsp:Transcript_47399/g.148276  ORF Transcript_47399/g.148276 Transcript_47399/m.148276 type:complete len:261 (-) Transcript_47399:435-1217(-)